ncbi:MAG: tetratricopeptide repeat protein [Peptococcaceae bacterium]|jgi:tetratricopeptide (TPR) repeat protein|nr:tetratricopeptide repeat protein [Peptococcaceae bacterium]
MRDRADELKETLTRLDREGNYQAMLPLLEEAAGLTRDKYGDASAEYGAALNDWGAVLRDIGRYQEAEDAFIKARAALEVSRGAGHPDYATTLNNIAGLYRLWEKYDKAEEFYIAALAIYQKTLGEEHFLHTSACNNLGLVYQARGQFAKARELHLGSLERLRESGNRLAITTTLSNLGQTYLSERNYPEALRLFSQVKDDYGELVGTGHPLYATALNNLGAVSYLMGKYDEARHWYEESLGICEATFGPDAPQTAAVKRMLGQRGAKA